MKRPRTAALLFVAWLALAVWVMGRAKGWW